MFGVWLLFMFGVFSGSSFFDVSSSSAFWYWEQGWNVRGSFFEDCLECFWFFFLVHLLVHFLVFWELGHWLSFLVSAPFSVNSSAGYGGGLGVGLVNRQLVFAGLSLVGGGVFNGGTVLVFRRRAASEVLCACRLVVYVEFFSRCSDFGIRGSCNIGSGLSVELPRLRWWWLGMVGSLLMVNDEIMAGFYFVGGAGPLKMVGLFRKCFGAPTDGGSKMISLCDVDVLAFEGEPWASVVFLNFG
ncbi:unnamed protein product [Amaranthus hypochondriacus]